VIGAEPTLVVWYRPDVRRAVWRAWSVAVVFVTFGVTCLLIPWLVHEPGEGWRIAVRLLGGLSLASGPTYLVVRLQKVLGPEIYLAVHRNGVRWCDEQGFRDVPWERFGGAVATEDAVTVSVDEEPAVVIRDPMMGIDRPGLAALLTQYHRQVLMGVPLRAPDTEP
jgi:hypothetical protein